MKKERDSILKNERLRKVKRKICPDVMLVAAMDGSQTNIVKVTEDSCVVAIT